MVGLVVEYLVELLIWISQGFVHGISILGLLFILQVGGHFSLKTAEHILGFLLLHPACYSLSLIQQNKFPG